MEAEIESGPWKAAIAELEGLLALAPPETSKVFRRDFLSLPDASLGLSKLGRHFRTTGGAEHSVLLLEPSDLLVGILKAFRAKNWELIGGLHRLSPQVYNCLEITEAMIEAGARPLFEDASLSIGPSESRYFAGKVLRCALEAARSENHPRPCQS